MADLGGQVAVVTGGGGGIGSAICQRLADAGAQIVITYHSDQGQSAGGREHALWRQPSGYALPC